MNSKPSDCPALNCECADHGDETVDTCPYRIFAKAVKRAEDYSPIPDPWENAPSQVVVPGERLVGKPRELAFPYCGLTRNFTAGEEISEEEADLYSNMLPL